MLLATCSSCAEIGCAQDDIGRMQSRSAAAGTIAAAAAVGGVFSPRPRYSFWPADGGALRSCAKERGRDRVEMSRSRPNQLDPAEVELGVAAGRRALRVGVDRRLVGDQQVGRQAKHRAVGLEDQMLHRRELGSERAEQLP